MTTAPDDSSSAPVEAPLPEITERMAPFWSGARRGRLVLQHCARCSRHYFPAVEACSRCLASDALGWVDASGWGESLSPVTRQQFYHPVSGGGGPYPVADVRPAEGPRMPSRLTDWARADAH